MLASRAGTKRYSPADMSIQFKQLCACQAEGRGGLVAPICAPFFRPSIQGKKIPARISTKPLDIVLPLLSLPAPFDA